MAALAARACLALLTIMLASCVRQDMGELCAPAEASSALRAATAVASGPTQVYWDGSESIAGYVDGATESIRPLGDLEALIRATDAQTGGASQWFRFGERITPLRAAAAVANAEFYRCGGGRTCDNQESHIDAVLNAIAARQGPGLSVVLTDLWLSNSAFRGSAEVALGQPFRMLLGQGKSIGVLGIRAPYSGPVYDVPGIGVHRGARERPLFILLIGSRLEVLTAYRQLAQSGSPALTTDRIRFSLFTTEPTNAPMGADVSIEAAGSVAPAHLADDEYSAQAPQLRLGLEALRRGEDVVAVNVQPEARALPGAVWRGRLNGDSRVWRRVGDCGAGAWEEEPALSGAWREGRSPLTATFKLDQRSASELVADSDYLIEARLYSTELEADPPETDWMREWSVSPERAAALSHRAPGFFPALNLAGFAEQLESALDEAAREDGLPLATLDILVRVEP